jgi:predicted nucleic acid-binding protein
VNQAEMANWPPIKPAAGPAAGPIRPVLRFVGRAPGELDGGVCNRAAAIRAAYRFKPLDSPHLAAAVVHGCDRFLTNDARLSTSPDIPVELLS